ncbi:formylglycine-generating enzyme family protein [Thermomonospora umbrina]
MSPGNEMVAVPAGRVVLSDRRTRRTWPVELRPYEIAAYPVTQALYEQITGLRPSTANADALPVERAPWGNGLGPGTAPDDRLPVEGASSWDGLGPGIARGGGLPVEGASWEDGLGPGSARSDRPALERGSWGDGLRPGTAGGDRLPVEGVSWWDAVRFCNALSERDGLTPAYDLGEGDDVAWDEAADGYRLPTEAEWEHACRAGTEGPRYGPLEEIAWHRGNSQGRIHEVGGKRPNPWGLYDMLGNVWDWCWDLYDAEVYGAYRVLRGGGWFDEHWSCRASVRRRSHPTFKVDDVGFRLARSPRA